MNTTAGPDATATGRVATLLQQGDLAAAETLARAARERTPGDPELVRLHGVALLMLGRIDPARRTLARAVELAPGSIAATSNLASAVLAAGDHAAAVHLFRQLVDKYPQDAALHNNLANALRAAGDDAAARDQYLAALAIEPAHFNAIVNLAATELALGATDAAEARLRAVLSGSPHPQALLVLGHVLNRQRRHAEAQAAYEHGARLAPAAAEFPYQAGLMADEQHHYAEAAALYRLALQRDPGLHLAEGQLLFVLRRECDWEAARPLSRRVRERALDGSGEVDPFAFLAEDATSAEQLACARARAAKVVRDTEATRRRTRLSEPPSHPGQPLRVGFVSAGFHAHATALLIVAAFEALGRCNDLETHLFATTPDDGSDVRRRLRVAVHSMHECAGQPEAALAQRIHAAAIDVLVDVDGWCAGGVPGAFALRPAPIQASWLAYPGTTGAPYIDWLIADRFVIPEAARSLYAESIAYLPRCYQPSDTARVVDRAPPRSAFGLPEGAMVFANFNNAWKLNEASFTRMCAVLAGVPGSVLWLLDAGRDADARLREAAHARGIDPARLVFSPALPHLAHLARYQRADLFLDTNPYNAHTTASDAIWAGCPVLSRPGDTFASRVAGSLNHHLHMPELNAPDDAAFVATAIRLGNDRAVLSAIHARVAEQRTASGLFDMHGYAHDFVAVLKDIASVRLDRSRSQGQESA